jgi:hypothetical protein
MKLRIESGFRIALVVPVVSIAFAVRADAQDDA